MGSSWLHGVCNENSLAPLIRLLGLRLYRTSGNNSVLYDHDLESYTLFDKEGRQVPHEITVKVRDEHTDGMPLIRAISIVLDRNPQLIFRVCNIKYCSGAYVDWKHGLPQIAPWLANLQEHVLTGGHGLMVHGYDPVIKALARDLEIHLNHICRM
ncbi:hypothetical protein GUJ93_ZPchr0013g36148 [Zizania palustris]|uniref:Uncharacterized protein n=1 Tax=Zizania palustris TaxID=103762 RepID=A0A8J5WZ74_ZIZPA|nr:hypothetical protein GUJ93_ZPchr0013g36148 [Zizania palustris]